MVELIYKDDLSETQNETRLVTVSPGAPTDELVCTLGRISLDNAPQFEALSYTWGDESQTLDIALSGASLAVTTNLEAALRHLRHESQSRVLWIDAISINQSNVFERNSQVSQMGKIYRSASKVLVWLCAESGAISPALELIEELTSPMGKHWSRDRPNSVWEKLAQDPILNALSQIFSLAWWWRVWTVQETLLAKEIDFIYGKRALPNLFKVAEGFFTHVAGCCQDLRQDSTGQKIIAALRSQFDNAYMLSSFRESESGDLSSKGDQRLHGTKLLNLIVHWRFRKCKDPRDRIYGLLGLATGFDKDELIAVDYQSSIVEVFTRSALAIIRRTGTLNIFTQLARNCTDAALRTHNLPTWVPDWNTLTNLRSCTILAERLGWMQFYKASRSSFESPAFLDSRELMLRGSKIDTLEWVGEDLSQEANTSGTALWRSHVKGWRKALGIDSNPQRPYPYQPHCDVYDAFWQTLCSGLIYEDLGGGGTSLTRLHKDEHRACFEAFYTRFVDPTAYIKSRVNLGYVSEIAGSKFLDHLARSVPMRAFFTTKGGHMGLAPAGSRPGDRAVLLSGSAVPYIIRDTGRSTEASGERLPTSELLGDCYIHGIMDGESVDEAKSISVLLV